MIRIVRNGRGGLEQTRKYSRILWFVQFANVLGQLAGTCTAMIDLISRVCGGTPVPTASTTVADRAPHLTGTAAFRPHVQNVRRGIFDRVDRYRLAEIGFTLQNDGTAPANDVYVCVALPTGAVDAELFGPASTTYCTVDGHFVPIGGGAELAALSTEIRMAKLPPEVQQHFVLRYVYDATKATGIPSVFAGDDRGTIRLLGH